MLSAEDIVQLQAMVSRVTVDESLVDYMLAIVERTRSNDSLALGVSPRISGANQTAPDLGGSALERLRIHRVAAEKVNLLQLRKQSRTGVAA